MTDPNLFGMETKTRPARQMGGPNMTREEVAATPEIEPDFYLDENGYTVFTAAYHLKRGSCCSNGCCHCPY